jgi:hypothetical protein
MNGRFGQMEVDCFAALGAAHFLAERLKTTSDEFILPVCAKCGMIAEYCRETGYRFCKPCYSGDQVYTVSVSYSSKLFIQELFALHKRAQFDLGDNDADPHAVRAAATKGELKPVAVDMLQPDSICDFLNVPRPEDWEFDSLGIPRPPSLRDEIEEITTGLEKLEVRTGGQKRNTNQPPGSTRATTVAPSPSSKTKSSGTKKSSTSKTRKPRSLFTPK